MKPDKWLNRIMIMALLVMVLCGCTIIGLPEESHKPTAIIGLVFGVPGLILFIRHAWNQFWKQWIRK